MQTTFADLVEGRAKQGGQVYMSSELNGPVVSNDSNVDLPKHFLFMPCLAMEDVPAHLQPMCGSIVDPRRPEVFIRSYNDGNGRPEIYLEGDLDYDPREPETFEKDASFIVWEDFFFPGFSAFESVSYQRRLMRVGSQGRIQMSYIQNTAEFRNAASFTGDDHSTWSTSFGLLNLCLAVTTLCLKNVPPLTCYNLNIHDPITIIFGRSVTKKVINQTMFCFPTSCI